MDLWKISKHNQFGGNCLFAETPLRILQTGMFSQTTFVRFQMIEFSPEFYKIASPSSPWQLAVRMSSMGKTSYWLENITRCQKTGTQMVRCLNQGVRVDLKTHRPIPLPVEGLEMYRRVATASPPPRFTFPNNQPASDRLFKMSIKAALGDTDRNNHVNQGAFMRYCIDCASLAAKHGEFFERFSKDMAYYNLKRVSMEYLGEVNAGDEMQMICWEDPSRAGALCFLID